MRAQTLVLSFVFSVLASTAFATSPVPAACFQVFKPDMESIARARDSRPANLQYIDPSPTAFFEKVQARFEKQKQRDPARPYGFVMPELKDTVLSLREAIAERLTQYGAGHDVIWRKSDPRWIQVFSRLGMRSSVVRIYENARVERDLLRTILNDLQTLDENQPPYDELIRLSYYSSRALALTNEFYRPFRMFLLNHLLQSKLKSPATELEEYRSRPDLFVGVRKLSTSKSIFTDASEIFDPERLQMILLPALGAIDSTTFIRLQGVPIYPVGVLASDLSADGWIFSSVELFLHDMYFHGGLLTWATNSFVKKHQLTDELAKRFQLKQGEWFERFITDVEKVEDPTLKNGIMDLTLTILHDRAWIFYPKTFMEVGSTRIGRLNTFTIGRAYWYIMGQLRNTGLSTNLWQNLAETDRALTWLKNYWSQPEFSQDPLVLEIEARLPQKR